MKIILDTNVFVSGVLGGKVSFKILDLLIENRFELLLSPSIFEEYTSIISRPRFKLPKESIQDILLYISKKGCFVYPSRKISIIEDDPSDNKFLEAAVEGNADFLVSGDSHLLKLKRFDKTKIVTITDFLKIFYGN